jgi:hypothetical protein
MPVGRRLADRCFAFARAGRGPVGLLAAALPGATVPSPRVFMLSVPALEAQRAGDRRDALVPASRETDRRRRKDMLLNRGQRDALYQFVVTDLVGVGDVALLLQAGRVAQAQRLRVRFEEDSRLLDLLGWRATEDRCRYELARSEESVRVLGRLRAAARELIEEAEAERAGGMSDDAAQVLEVSAVVLEEPRP